MARDTSRDLVWSAALDRREELVDESSNYTRGFTAEELHSDLVDEGVDVSERHVRDVLVSMANAGELASSKGGGRSYMRFKPPADLVDEAPSLCSVCAVRFTRDVPVTTISEHPSKYDYFGDETDEYHLCDECVEAYPDDLDDREGVRRGEGSRF